MHTHTHRGRVRDTAGGVEDTFCLGRSRLMLPIREPNSIQAIQSILSWYFFTMFLTIFQDDGISRGPITSHSNWPEESNRNARGTLVFTLSHAHRRLYCWSSSVFVFFFSACIYIKPRYDTRTRTKEHANEPRGGSHIHNEKQRKAPNTISFRAGGRVARIPYIN